MTTYHPKSWSFPAVKSFSCKRQWAEKKKDTQLKNAEYKKKFIAGFREKNQNELQHMFEDKHLLNS